MEQGYGARRKPSTHNPQRFLFVPVLSCPVSSAWMFDVVLFVFKVTLKGLYHQPENTPQCVWLTEVPACFISPSQKPAGAPLNYIRGHWPASHSAQHKGEVCPTPARPRVMENKHPDVWPHFHLHYSQGMLGLQIYPIYDLMLNTVSARFSAQAYEGCIPSP